MKIYLVYENSDMCEGRGPMIIHAAFTSFEEAAAYMDYRPGVMGRREKWSIKKHGDWEIKEIETFNTAVEKDSDYMNNKKKYAEHIKKELEYRKQRKQKEINKLQQEFDSIEY